MKLHDLKTVVVDHSVVQYFYTKEKNDRNGNPRYRIYIIDPDGPAVYETIARTYDGLIPAYVKKFVEEATACE